MTLREQLAKRLGEIMKSYGYENALADEVIRQMEWARKRCGPRHAPPVYTEYGSRPIHVEGGFDALTLAPEDWKP